MASFDPVKLSDDELDEMIGELDHAANTSGPAMTEAELVAFVETFDPVTFEAEYQRADDAYREWLGARIAASRARYAPTAATPFAVRPIPADLGELLAAADAILETMTNERTETL